MNKLVSKKTHDKLKMCCSDILVGNKAIRRRIHSAGLELYIQSMPYEGSEVGGGDVYFVSSCDAGHITRLLLADICGHGRQAAEFVKCLKDSVRRNVNRTSQSSFVRQINRDFMRSSAADQMATAAVTTYYADERRLSLISAGHPNPLYFRQRTGQWYKVNDELPSFCSKELLNMPIGLKSQSTYASRSISVEGGDALFLYSDAFSEATDRSGKYLSVDGLLKLMNRMLLKPGRNLIDRLTTALKRANPDNLTTDDVTAMVGLFTA